MAHPQQEFSHLFPTGAVAQAPETPKESKGNVPHNGLSSFNAGVDYVIVFRFPEEKTEQNKKKVSEALISLTRKLSRAGLWYQIKPGKTSDVLLILVACPSTVLEEEIKRERVRDFLLGIRVSGLEQAGDAFTAKDLTEAERLRLVYEILTGLESDGGANISPGLDDYVESITPLHNDEFNKGWIHAWSKKWLINKEDLMNIRNQFGEKVAFYFAYLQNYLLWLAGPAVLGLLITISGAQSLSVWYSLAMLVWSVVFIEVWKRKEQEIAVAWNVRNCSKHEKRRLEFKGDRTVTDQVTGEEMPYCPLWKLFMRRALSVPGVALGAVALSIIVTCVFVLQLFLHEYYAGPFRQILHYAPTIGYALLIPTMSNVYSYWVRILNNWEMHETDTSWEYHYTQKIFVANFLVSYLSLFFIAWVYIPFGDHVLPYLTELNISHNHKKADFQRLRAQLVYFVVTGQIIGFATEMILPYAVKKILPKLKKKLGKNEPETGTEEKPAGGSEAAFMEKLYREIDLPEYNIYTDYVEMVIQFGYVSMFSTVWPLTALCCMINNWLELRGDAVKICKYTRRPVPLRAEGIGPWIGNNETLTWLSSVTMASFAYLFHPSTDIHSRYTSIFTVLAVLLAEHIYVIIRLVVRSALDAIPSRSDILVRQEDYRLKKIWLQRILVDHAQGNKQSTLEENIRNELAEGSDDTLTQTFWTNHSQDDGLQLISNALKTD